MFKKILVAVDGSHNSREALNMATDLAKQYRAKIELVHAFPHVSDLLGTPQYEHLLEARSAIGGQILDTMRQQVPAEMLAEVQLLEGPPAPAILRVAEEDGCDLIVLGSRGHGQLAGILLGSVSNTVAQRARCAVLIVHSQN
ncbi:MAG TPA: universal stress protein [Kouleothrix sp.]|uniref:universal stress protein n=1 Tax=Kouleothrix sp. TaxID=2779161 RepID=UPI002BA35529|nr:universal stress protein [Kouleothrix sp.]HRC77203.1 universal stress protein [Kouleothrix sp.]